MEGKKMQNEEKSTLQLSVELMAGDVADIQHQLLEMCQGNMDRLILSDGELDALEAFQQQCTILQNMLRPSLADCRQPSNNRAVKVTIDSLAARLC